jgi:hypothetical protein
MNRIILILIFGLLIVSCSSPKAEKENLDTETVELTKKEFYLNKMKEKNFQLEINGPCNDALEDTIHERFIAYIDSKVLTDNNTIIEFKFKEACCQEFLGDYSIENDTLKFIFEQVNEEVCSCICWYRYKLSINEPHGSYKDIKIEGK